jgi:hypothetical protein
MLRRVTPHAQVRISAVLPYFNQGAIIRTALASLRAQSRPLDEIIVVDDGSTDSDSLVLLDELVADDITVLHQPNSGPGAARNTGALQSEGDAILFLDGDDSVGPDHVAVALAALSSAPDDVGFVYPDMQFTGNGRQLVVMPPYNLYLLLYRNFCCIGGLIDRGVFDAGLRFASEAFSGHEDWDFFVRLGLAGIAGAGFHGSPLHYRRWGYSRSDGINEAEAAGADLRVHPAVGDGKQLVPIKREWAPALSIVAPVRPAARMAAQSCDDFEFVAHVGTVPRTRGRWVLMLTEEGLAGLTDSTLVERLARLVTDAALPVALSLYPPAPGAREWVPVDGSPGIAPWGVLTDGATYGAWSRGERTGSDALALARFLGHVDGHCAWAGGHPRSSDGSGAWGPDAPLTALRSPRQPPSSGAEGSVEHYASEVERAFRHHEAPPLFVPARGLSHVPVDPAGKRPGLVALAEGAWRDWAPSRSRQLQLVVNAAGQVALEAGHHVVSPRWKVTDQGSARVPVGRIWSQPFPGTACLVTRGVNQTERATYAVVDAPAVGSDEVLGYLSVEPMPGRTELTQAVQAALRTVEGAAGVVPPMLAMGVPTAYVEDAPSWSPQTAAARRWPLYEVIEPDGSARYTSHPDGCVARPVPGQRAAALAEVPAPADGPPAGDDLLAVEFAAEAGESYLTGRELALGGRTPVSVRPLARLQTRDIAPEALVRLAPSPSAAGIGAHQLRLASRVPLSEGDRVEGVMGYAWPTDPTRGPLYRWRAQRGDGGHALLSLGEGAPLPASQHEGTLGLAWWPGSSLPDQMDLWEMERRGAVGFTCERGALEQHGFVARRIVAKVRRTAVPGTVPLHAMYSPDRQRCLVSTCLGEGVRRGLTEVLSLGFVEAGVPEPQSSTPADTDAIAGGSVDLEVWRRALSVDGGGGYIAVWVDAEAEAQTVGVGEPPSERATVVGFALDHLEPFAHPLYRVGETPDSVTSRLPQWALVRDVVCFLPGEGRPLAASAPTSSASSSRWKRSPRH